MNSELLAHTIGIPVREIQRLFRLDRVEMYNDSEYRRLVREIDLELLGTTLPLARQVYDRIMPDVIAAVRSEFDYAGRGMSAFTLGNWVIGFLTQPDELSKLLEFHDGVPSAVFEISLPSILDALNQIENGGREWAKAMAILSLPLLSIEKIGQLDME